MRAAESIDYEAVLTDLRDKRAKLDAAIAAIEQFMLGRPASTVATGLEGPEDSRHSGHAAEKVRSDSFFGMTAVEAAMKFLRMSKRPQAGKVIHDALLEGGFTTTAKNFYSNLYTAMMRSDDLVNLGRTKGWGLAEWYPGRRIDQQPKGKSDERAAEDEEGAKKAEGDGRPNGAEASPSTPPAESAPEPSAAEQLGEQSPTGVAN